MASGLVCRANRPNTWLHRSACKREEKPCQLGAHRGNEPGEPTEVLGDRHKGELVLCAAGATQSQPAKPENALQVREQHLNALTIVPELHEGVSRGVCERDVGEVFVGVLW